MVTSALPINNYIDVFSSTFKSNEPPLVWSAGTVWVVAFDYGNDTNGTFSEILSVEVKTS